MVVPIMLAIRTVRDLFLGSAATPVASMVVIVCYPGTTYTIRKKARRELRRTVRYKKNFVKLKPDKRLRRRNYVV
ncbi:hypothetical protein GCM10010136_16830 [Limoniibacter endophyticus]|uniref:Uncharacterized protein n=1 Tax=Limoniibacter endophyticus TaxID=1565040 RepID=A0A8J3GG27_9HYPH|nr:hypothetical protein GCM10010136_16830 [Limoniibacter endophyticus]